jgi:hypothetical protein
MGAEIIHVEEQTDVTKLTKIILNFADAAKNEFNSKYLKVFIGEI